MVHVPTPTSVTVLPDTVQIDVVVDAKLTAKWEVAVNGAAPYLRFGNEAKVIV
jgi:hypothetical protein